MLLPHRSNYEYRQERQVVGFDKPWRLAELPNVGIRTWIYSAQPIDLEPRRGSRQARQHGRYPIKILRGERATPERFMADTTALRGEPVSVEETPSTLCDVSATYSEITVRPPPPGSLSAGLGSGETVYLSLAAEIDGEWTRLTYVVGVKERRFYQAAEEFFLGDASCIPLAP